MATPITTLQPSHPSTDSDEMLPPTIQELSPTTTVTDSDTEIQTQPIPEVGTSGEPDNVLSFPVTTTGDQVDSQRVSVLIAGTVASVMLVIIIIAVITVSLAVWLKVMKLKQAPVPVTINQAYGLTHQDMVTHTKEVTYNYSAVDQADIIEVKQNEAYATNIVTEGNEAYATNISTERNEAYVTHRITERNEAVTSFSGTVDESFMYDYI